MGEKAINFSFLEVKGLTDQHPERLVFLTLAHLFFTNYANALEMEEIGKVFSSYSIIT